MAWINWIFGILVALPVLFFAVAGLLFWTRGTPLRRIRSVDGDDSPPPPTEEAFLQSVVTHLGTSMAPGHDVELFFEGDALYPRLFEDLEGARELVTWHVFWFRPGRLADRLKSVLIERARAGVRVLFLHDWFGSRDVDAAYWEELRDAGVEVRPFRRLRPATLFKAQQRSHVRTVVVDGRIGYTGGFAIADEWTGDGRSPGSWRDTSVRFEGPAVHQLQAAFAADWGEATGELVVGPGAFPAADTGLPLDPPAGRGPATGRSDPLAGLFYSAPSLGGTEAERLFALTICSAAETLWITSGYFVPGASFRGMLIQAAERGVDVRILHAGKNTDRRATWYAVRRHYEEMLAGGVRIWEYDPTMAHAKTLVADGVWSAIGTINFDNRSMTLNDEVSLLVHDSGVARRLQDRFLADLERSTEVELETFGERGPWERAKERLWAPFSRLL